MIQQIRDEIVKDLNSMCEEFELPQPIDEEMRDEITYIQYRNLPYPRIFYQITDTTLNGEIDKEKEKDRYEVKFTVIMTLEDTKQNSSFDMLYLFLENRKATNNFFKKRKYKRKIRDLVNLQNREFYYSNRKYYKKVLQFNYYAEFTMEEF